MFGIRNWTSDTWTAVAAVVAFLALVQPWFIAIWRRFFRRGTIDIYENGRIEIGFSAFGPSIGLMGTLRSRNRDMFVQAATLNLIKRDSRFHHKYEWILFRNPKMVFGTSQSSEVSVEAPSSFMILMTQPFRYNIAFYDVALFQTLQPITEKFKQDFLTYIDQKTDLNIHAQALDENAREKLTRQLRFAHNKFRETGTYQNAVNSFAASFYWEAGTYDIELLVHAARPHKTVSKSWSFSLSPAEIENLRSNVPSVFEEIVGLPFTAPYGFAYPQYVQNPRGCLRLLIRNS
jgi:hypothetical protein